MNVSMRSVNTNQSGAISLISVIVISVILAIMTLGFLRITITEQRQAIDDDLSSRAVLAAEAGIDDGKRALQNYLDPATRASVTLNQTVCDHAQVGSEPSRNILSDIDDLDIQYTCQLIDPTPEAYQVDVDAFDSFQLPLKGTRVYEQVRIRWHVPEDGDPVTPRANNDFNLPEVDAWNTAGHPAMPRLMFFGFESGDGRDEINQSVRTAFVVPDNSSPSAKSKDDLQNLPNASKIGASCSNSFDKGGYTCEVRIRDFTRTNIVDYYLRVNSIYSGAHYQIELLDSSGNPVPMVDAQASIDSTGRSGDVSRRLEVRVDLTPPELPWLPDYVIESAERICKNFSITDNGSEFEKVNGSQVIGSCKQSTINAHQP